MKNLSSLLLEISRLGNNNLPIWYRGQYNIEWTLTPSICRGFSFNQEKRMTDEFISKASIRYSKTPTLNSYGEWLSLMQHFGLPTRLLDWTSSPLIALYFALRPNSGEMKSETDSCIWVLYPTLLNEIYEANVKDTILRLDSPYINALTMPAFSDNLGITDRAKILATSGIHFDTRMLIQQSGFTVHGLQTPFEFNKTSESYLKRIPISCEYREELLTELKNAGYNDSYLFPDLDHLSFEIKNKIS